MKKTTNRFSYKVIGGTVNGHFDIYQSKNGAILILMCNSYTVLSKEQIEDLKIDLYELEDFNIDKYREFYKL